MTFDVDEFLDGFQTRTAEARICTRSDLLEQYLEAREDAQSSLGGTSDRVRAIEAEMATCERVFQFQSISRREWLGLVAQHQPSKEQQRAGLDHDPATFPQAAIAACSTEPKITVEQAERLADRLPVSEFTKLWDAVLTCNLRSPLSPKAVLASVGAQRNGDFSTTPGQEESPEGDSLAGNDGL